jgi:DNA-binding NtrC family response regulator
VLIADDQRDVLEALRILLKGEGHQTESVTSISGIFNALQQRDYALLMMDLNYTRDTTSGQEGLEVIPKIMALDSTLPIVVMTAWATIDLAARAISCRNRGTTSGCSRLSGRRSSSAARCAKAKDSKPRTNFSSATFRI